MNHERATRPLVIVLAVVALAAAGLGMAGYRRGAPPPTTARFYLRSDGGAVLFEHARHGTAVGGCVDCHHELATGTVSCRECHDDPDYGPGTADHDELLEIHERACDSCHEIAPADEATGCRECHADEMARVYHESCNGCHLATAPETFADETGAARCRSCHLR